MKYLSVSQTAEKWGISTRRMQTLCNENRIEGAVRIGYAWAIPEDAPKPQDARIIVPAKLTSVCYITRYANGKNKPANRELRRIPTGMRTCCHTQKGL